MPSPDRLDVGGIDSAHRAADSEPLAMLIQPFPHRVVGLLAAVRRFKIGSAAVAIAAGCYAPAVERVAAMRLETGSKTLSIVVAKCAQNGPVNPGRVHGMSEIKEKFPEVRVHAADDIFVNSEA